MYWYTREKDGKDSMSSNELQAIKQKEEELMLQALGLKPKTQPTEHKPLEKHELAALLQKDSTSDAAGLFEEDRMKGLGYGRGNGLGEAAHEVLVAEGLPAAPQEGSGAGATAPVTLSAKDLKLLHKAMKRQAKGEKKKDKKDKRKKVCCMNDTVTWVIVAR